MYYVYVLINTCWGLNGLVFFQAPLVRFGSAMAFSSLVGRGAAVEWGISTKKVCFPPKCCLKSYTYMYLYVLCICVDQYVLGPEWFGLFSGSAGPIWFNDGFFKLGGTRRSC